MATMLLPLVSLTADEVIVRKVLFIVDARFERDLIIFSSLLPRVTLTMWASTYGGGNILIKFSL